MTCFLCCGLVYLEPFPPKASSSLSSLACSKYLHRKSTGKSEGKKHCHIISRPQFRPATFLNIPGPSFGKKTDQKKYVYVIFWRIGNYQCLQECLLLTVASGVHLSPVRGRRQPEIVAAAAVAASVGAVSTDAGNSRHRRRRGSAAAAGGDDVEVSVVLPALFEHALRGRFEL